MTTWQEFAHKVRHEPSHYHIQEESDWYINVIEGAPPHWRQTLQHQQVGGMDFVEVLAPLGDPDTISTVAALESVSQKLCGLTYLNGQLTIKLVVPLRGFDLTDWRWPLAAMGIFTREVFDEASAGFRG